MSFNCNVSEDGNLIVNGYQDTLQGEAFCLNSSEGKLESFESKNGFLSTNLSYSPVQSTSSSLMMQAHTLNTGTTIINHAPNSSSIRFSSPQCSSLHGFPRLPHPAKVNEEEKHVPLPVPLRPTRLLQPRLSTISRRSRHFVPNERKDEYYWQKRKKNNEAARKSREKRRTIDSVLEEKVMILNHENKLLRRELFALKVKYGEIDATDPDVCESDSDNNVQPDAHKYNLPLSPAMNGNDILSATAHSLKSDNVHAQLNNKMHFTENKINLSATLSQLQNGILANGENDLVISPMHLNELSTKRKVSYLDTKQTGISEHNVSSANVVLSNLATGTFVLSPVDLSVGESSKSHNATSRIAGDEVVGTSQIKPVDERNSDDVQVNLCNEMKTFEAASTLATLSQYSENKGANAEHQRQPIDVDMPDDDEVAFVSSSGATSSTCNEAKLPCKLRFKSSKID